MQNISLKSQHDPKGEIKKYVWVDALRGYAILLVIMSHTGQAIFGIGPPVGIINNGIHGVSLFFLASSFTLFNSYKNRSALDGKNRNVYFFIRRLFRIAPLFWIACLIYIVAGLLYQSQWIPPAPYDLVKILANVFFLNGIYVPAILYLPPGSWSIGDEMMFYIAIPFLFAMIRNLQAATFLVIAAIIGSMVLQILAYYAITEYTSYSWLDKRENALFLWLPNQFPVFCFGIALYFFLGTNKIKYKEWMLAVTVTGYFLLASFLPWNLNFPYFLIQNEYIYAALFFVFCFCISKTKIRFALIPINKLGMVSFSVYLIHFLIVDLGTWFSEITFAGQYKYLNFFLLFAFTVFTTYFIAKWTYEYIEKYGMALGERLIERIKTRAALKTKDLNSDNVVIQQNPGIQYSEDRSKIAGK